MKRTKKLALEAKGYSVGTVNDFLGLTKEESEYVEMKLALAKKLEKVRKSKKMTQVQLAKRIDSSQSRVAKMEAGDPTVSFDLLIKTFLALGTNRKTLAKIMAS